MKCLERLTLNHFYSMNITNGEVTLKSHHSDDGPPHVYCRAHIDWFE